MLAHTAAITWAAEIVDTGGSATETA
jgi:hypothetical protein